MKRLFVDLVLFSLFILVIFTDFAVAEAIEEDEVKPNLLEDTNSQKDDYAIIEEVTITGSRTETNNLNMPADVKVITESRLKRPGFKSAPEALSNVSGVKMNPRQEAATFNDFEMRGLSANTTSGGNVLVLLDGIPQRRLSFGGPYIGALPYDSITRVELVKGPMSSLYGRNALVGAMQLFSDPGSAEYKLNFLQTYEYPTNTVHTGLRTSGPIGKKPISGNKLSTFSLTGSFTYSEGWQPRNESTKGDVYFHSDLHITDKDTITLLAGYFSADEEYVAPVFVDEDGNKLLKLDRDTNLAVPDQNSLDLQEFRVAAKYKREWIPEISTNLAFSYWHGDTFWKVGRPSDTIKDSYEANRPASDRHFMENSFFTEFEIIGNYVATDWMKGNVNLGVSYEYLSYIMTMVPITTKEAFGKTGKFSAGIPIDWLTKEEPKRSEWVYGDQSQRDTFEHDTGIFFRKQFAFIDRIYLHVGLRFDYFDRTQKIPAAGKQASQDGWAISPGVGLNVAILKKDDYKLNVFSNWGRGFSPIFRAVSDTEFADVEPEKSESFDIGVKTQLWKRLLQASVVFYQLDRKDVVAWDSSVEQWQNSGVWRVRGVETDIRTRPIKELELYLAYAWRTPKIKESPTNQDEEGNKIPTISDHTFSSGVDWELNLGLGGGSEIRYVSGFYGNSANSFHLPGYVLWDVNLYYNWADTIRIAAYVKNLLDTEYYSAVFGGVKNGSAFEGTPRTYGITLKGDF